jgi:hypothetical protein
MTTLPEYEQEQEAAQPPVVAARWLQLAVFELLDAKYGMHADTPVFAVGMRGTDLVVFAPGGSQYVILFEGAL